MSCGQDFCSFNFTIKGSCYIILIAGNITYRDCFSPLHGIFFLYLGSHVKILIFEVSTFCFHSQHIPTETGGTVTCGSIGLAGSVVRCEGSLMLLLV